MSASEQHIGLDIAPAPGKKAPYRFQVGPIHPALKEPMMFDFTMDGETVVNVDLVGGHNHRGIEWMGMRRNPVQTLYLAERICGICSATHSFAFSRAMEDALDIPVPARAEYIRVIVAELERIHSHLLWAGVAAHEIGFDTLLHWTWKLREGVMDALEYISGNRVNYGMFQIGGVRRDITPEMVPKIHDYLDYYEGILGKIIHVFLNDKTVQMRTQNIGIATKEDVVKLAAVGPTARASGWKTDVRYNQPYSAYANLDIEPITPEAVRGEVVGDIYDRIIVRALEIKQSIEIIRGCVSQMEPGEILWEPKMAKLLMELKKRGGEGVGRHEAPRGEAIHYVKKVAGDENVTYWKVRASTYNNLLAWVPMLIGDEIADIPLIVASADPCFSCTDRVAITNNAGKTILTGEELHRLSVEKTRRLMQ
ncbi:MAG: NADH dehydrogenase subunit [Thermoplasmata archaeon HGW-Thermoplasmata-1]|nr:MAG: NADH dehydrogenase subunit [Thermoplasmata archaeon HGW-Thermoplasmata-1]